MMNPRMHDDVFYWSEMQGELQYFPAIIIKVHSDTVVDLHVMGGRALGTGDRYLVPFSHKPVSRAWSWPPWDERDRVPEAEAA